MANYNFQAIGTISTPYTDKAPYQPVDAAEGEFCLLLDPQLTSGLQDLERFRYIYVIYCIDRIERPVQMQVAPPWAKTVQVGLFASRSPVRPNPIGLSIVKLKKIVANRVYVSGLDVFDGTPLLDIKPYIADLDSKPDANLGWLEDLNNEEHLTLHVKGIPHEH